jgi:hypothetical protein
MMRPPMVMRIRIKNNDKNINLWLPLFILFPLLLIILIVLAPFALLAAIILLPFGMARTILAAPFILCVIHAMRGLEVDIAQKNNENVLISVK